MLRNSDSFLSNAATAFEVSRNYINTVLAGALFYIGLPTTAWAQTTTLDLLLLQAQGARGLALGESFVAVADGANSLYWNRAGLVSADKGLLEVPSATGRKYLLELNNHTRDDSCKKVESLNPIPIFVFGLTGMFLGAWAGHSIDDQGNMPGEPEQVFTKGTVIGMTAGLVAGGLVGYFLGKEKTKDESRQIRVK